MANVRQVLENQRGTRFSIIRNFLLSETEYVLGTLFYGHVIGKLFRFFSKTSLHIRTSIILTGTEKDDIFREPP